MFEMRQFFSIDIFNELEKAYSGTQKETNISAINEVFFRAE